MARLPLNTLPAFRAVARLANMRAAAEELHLTHSAVSQQIKLLEEQLGLPLFERRGRSLVLNASGAALQRAVEPALDRLAEGVQAAQQAAGGGAQTLRLTCLPSFAQRWLLPRMARWREAHPDITLELHTSMALADLPREGYHAGIRVGAGPWRGLRAERLMDAALIAVAAPQRAVRLAGKGPEAIADEPLLGEAEEWSQWFAQAGVKLKNRPVADFNDGGMLLQATESDLGVALVRELIAADALLAGRLVRLPGAAIDQIGHATYWLVFPTELADWAPLAALRRWILDEMALSQKALKG